MGVILLYSMLAVCGVLCVALIRRYDLHDREPWWAVLLAVALGAVAMFIAGRTQVWILSAGGSWAARNFNLLMAICAGVTEEAAKALVVVMLAVVCRSIFNDPLDGLIFGALAGLGAALEESVVFLLHEQRAGVLPGTEPVRLMGHLVMGGISGFGFGSLARVGRSSPATLARWWIPVGLGLGIGLHVLWDIVAFDAGDLGRMLAWHTASGMGLMAAGFVTFGLFVRIAHSRSPGAAQDQGSPASIA